MCMKTIIAPTDFSKVSIHAVEYATDLAASIKAELVILHVVQIPLIVSELTLNEMAEYESAAGAQTLELKKRLQQKVGDKILITSETKVGSIIYELEEMAKKIQPFLIVMGTDTLSRFERFFFQTTTVYATKQLDFPVLVIPETEYFAPIKNICLASDLLNPYEAPLSFLNDLISMYHSSLHVLHVSATALDENEASVIHRMMKRHLNKLSPKFHNVINYDFEEAVSGFILDYDIDLLIVMPKKTGIFHRSLTRKIVLHPKIPVVALQGRSDPHLTQ